MITRQVEHPHTMVMALVGALRAISTQGPPQRSHESMETTLEVFPVPALPGQRSSTHWCARCGSGFRMVTTFVAAAMADIGFRTLYQWAETGEIHFSVTPEGSLFVCLDSLLERVGAQN